MELSNINSNMTRDRIKANKPNSSISNKCSVDNFTTVEFTSRKDGKTYIGKKVTLNKNGEKTTGIYVFDKNSEPDAMGKIKGEFMSYDDFMRKMTDEIPSVNADTIKSYNANIKTYSEEEKFDKAFEKGCKLSDGSILIRPNKYDAVTSTIKPSKQDGKYDIISKLYTGYKNEETVRTLCEDDLIRNKELCRGTIKRLDDNYYIVTYYKDNNFKNHEMATEIMDKETCMELINLLFYI